jgi:hypothetical protein
LDDWFSFFPRKFSKLATDSAALAPVLRGVIHNDERRQLGLRRPGKLCLTGRISEWQFSAECSSKPDRPKTAPFKTENAWKAAFHLVKTFVGYAPVLIRFHDQRPMYFETP